MNSKNRKNTALLIYILSIVFYIAAIIEFMSNKSIAIMFLLFGTTMLMLGIATTMKIKKDERNDE